MIAYIGREALLPAVLKYMGRPITPPPRNSRGPGKRVRKTIARLGRRLECSSRVKHECQLWQKDEGFNKPGSLSGRKS